MHLFKYGNIWENEVDVIVIPHIPCDDILPEVTEKIYEKAGYVKMRSAYPKAKAEAEREAEEKYLKNLAEIPDDKAYREKYGVIRSEKVYSPDLRKPPVIAVTPGFGLKAKYALHIVVDLETWHRDIPKAESDRLLTMLSLYYYALLDRANELGAKTVALPVLGTCMLRFPINFAGDAAARAVNRWNIRRRSEIDKIGGPKKVIIVLPGDGLTMERKKNPFRFMYDREDREEDADIFERSNVFVEYENKLAEKIESSGKDKETFLREKSYEYINSIANASNLTKDLGFGSEVITRFKIKQSNRSGGHIPVKWRVISIAIAMELDDYERFEFVRCAGYQYPSEQLDFEVEKLMRAGIRDFKKINKNLCRINPEYDLTKPARSNGKNQEI